MTLISVIIPVYNAQSYLVECIESILNQTHDQLEVILVNDGSRDDSMLICKDYTTLDSRIRFYDKSNSGVSDTRNLGLDHATGEYVCFVDSDDVLDSRFIETLYEAMLEVGVDSAFSGMSYLYDGHLVHKIERMRHGVYAYSDLRKKIIDDGTLSGILLGSVCCGMYRRDVIESLSLRFDPKVRYNEDGVFNVAYAMATNKIALLTNKYYYHYRQNPTSSTAQFHFENRYKDATEALKVICADQAEAMDLERQLKARTVSEHFWVLLNICHPDNGLKWSQVVNRLSILLNDEELKKSYDAIDKKAINKYKYIYYRLMYRRFKFTIILLTRYIYPVLRRRLKR